MVTNLPFDLNRQISDAIFSCSTKIEEKELELEVSLDDVCHIVSDEDMLYMVWQNLLSNAIKFTDPGGKIIVRLQQDAHNTIVSVQDTGCGMSEETIRHIFDKFYQGDTSHSSEGNSLGLAICSKILKLLRGEIFVNSEIGVGTTFTIFLPKE